MYRFGLPKLSIIYSWIWTQSNNLLVALIILASILNIVSASSRFDSIKIQRGENKLQRKLFTFMNLNCKKYVHQ